MRETKSSFASLGKDLRRSLACLLAWDLSSSYVVARSIAKPLPTNFVNRRCERKKKERKEKERKKERKKERGGKKERTEKERERKKK